MQALERKDGSLSLGIGIISRLGALADNRPRACLELAQTRTSDDEDPRHNLLLLLMHLF